MGTDMYRNPKYPQIGTEHTYQYASVCAQDAVTPLDLTLIDIFTTLHIATVM